MTEINAEDAYDTVMADLQRRLPELYVEVIAEIDRGRELKASEISRTDMSSRNRDLTSQRLSKLSDSDLAVVALTPKERLMVLARAISVATESHNASVATLARFAEEHGAERFEFVSPDQEPLDETSTTADERQAPERSRRSLDIHSGGAMNVSREPIDAVLETLGITDEHD